MKIKNKISKKAKIAGAKAFKDLGFSVRDIAAMTGFSLGSIINYQRQESDEEIEQFRNTIKKMYLHQDFELSQLAVKHIKNKIDKARFFELVGLLKTVRELQAPRGASTAVQVNFNQHIQNEKNEFTKNEN